MYVNIANITTHKMVMAKKKNEVHLTSGPSLAGGPGGPWPPHFLGDKVIFFGIK